MIMLQKKAKTGIEFFAEAMVESLLACKASLVLQQLCIDGFSKTRSA